MALSHENYTYQPVIFNVHRVAILNNNEIVINIVKIGC